MERLQGRSARRTAPGYLTVMPLDMEPDGKGGPDDDPPEPPPEERSAKPSPTDGLLSLPV